MSVTLSPETEEKIAWFVNIIDDDNVDILDFIANYSTLFVQHISALPEDQKLEALRRVSNVCAFNLMVG